MKTVTPFNLALHEHLLAQGYEHRRIDADWEDVGTADSGPLLHGHNAYDEYAGKDELVFSTEEGELDREPRDYMFELWLAGHGDDAAVH
jgi:hypothetical protein